MSLRDMTIVVEHYESIPGGMTTESTETKHSSTNRRVVSRDRVLEMASTLKFSP